MTMNEDEDEGVHFDSTNIQIWFSLRSSSSKAGETTTGLTGILRAQSFSLNVATYGRQQAMTTAMRRALAMEVGNGFKTTP